MKRQQIKFVYVFFCVFLVAACAISGKPPVSQKVPSAVSDGKPFLGVGYAPVAGFQALPIPEGITGGLRIVQIVPQSAAHRAGLQMGDIIVAYDNRKVTETAGSRSSDSFRDYIQTQKKIGEILTLEIIRKETIMVAEQDGRETPLHSMDAVQEMVQAMPYGQHAGISINKQVDRKTVDVILSSKPGITRELLPTNGQLYPDFEAIYDPYRDLSLQLIHDLHLVGVYQDILDEFSENEQWDDAFRLNLFRYIHRDPLRAGIAVEQTCRAIEKTVRSREMAELLKATAGILDESINVPADALPAPPKKGSPLQHHMQFIDQITALALQYRNQAVAGLTGEERQYLADNLYQVLTDSESLTSSAKQYPERVAEPLLQITALSHKIDYPALFTSAALLARLTDEQWLLEFQTLLKSLPVETASTVSGVKGDILYAAETAVGPLIIGGKGANQYSISPGIIIDPGGDDIYLDGAGAKPEAGVSLIIDCSGNDQYSATGPFSTGGGFLGSALLIDLSGDDTYTGTFFSQGCGIMGVGVLADHQGNDRYIGQEYSQGMGIWGMGLLLDHDGQDIYSSGAMSQGVGGPKGVGLLSDLAGDDQYSATGRYAGSYGTKGIFNGLSQGFGFGFRGISSGGVGIVMEGDGDDRFLAGNFSQGCGYAYGLGILKNGGQGNDRYMGSRYAQGCSAHSAAGVLIDDGGDDHYAGLMGALQGAAWDMGLAVLIDKSGDDTYDSRNLFFSQAAAAYTGIALFVDENGSDRYYFPPGQDKTPYRDQRNLSFFIDSGGGPDRYNEDTGPNSAIQITGEQHLHIDLDQDIVSSLQDAHYRKLIRKAAAAD